MKIFLICEKLDHLLFDSDRLVFLATACIFLSVQLCHNVFKLPSKILLSPF